VRILPKQKPFLFFFLLTLLLLPGQIKADQLTGPAFSNPDLRQSMPPGWQTKPISHDPSLGKVDLVITLNQQFMNFAPYIEEYAAKNKLKIQINKGTCGISAGATINKKVDIAGFCCPPGKSDRLPGLIFHTIGIHPISILVHKNNPINDLSMEQIRNIFKGDIVRWSEVGGPNSPILPVARLHCKKRPGHWRLILDNADLFSPSTRIVASIKDMLSIVSSKPGTLGYEVIWQNKNYKNLKTITVDGLNPKNLGLLKKNQYKLFRVLYLSTWKDNKDAHPHALKLVNYIRKQVEKDAKDIGMVPVSELREYGWQFKNDEVIGLPNGL